MQKEEPFLIVPKAFFTCDVWRKDKFSKLESFLWLIYQARWQSLPFNVNNIMCKRGQVVVTYSELMQSWNLSDRKEAKRYLDWMTKKGLVSYKTDINGTLVSITHLVDECHNVATSIATPIATSKYSDNQVDINNNATPIATPIATNVPQLDDPSHAQVVLNLFDDNVDSNYITNKEKEKHLYAKFEQFRLKYKSYGGKVRGFQTELEDFKKKHKDWKEVIPMLEYAIDKENEARVEANSQNIFFARIQNLKTYLNQRSWEAYSDGWESYDPNAYHPEGFTYDAEFDAYRFCNYTPNYDLLDGYTDNNRPDGARIVEQINVWIWSKEQRRWNRE